MKKPSVLGEAVFKPLWESVNWTDFHQRRQFPQTSEFLSCRFPVWGTFSMKSSRQEGPGATLRLSVELYLPPFARFQSLPFVFLRIESPRISMR